jgi:hypothetical protein
MRVSYAAAPSSVCSDDGLDLTEPLGRFCPGFSLAEGLVIDTLRRQLVPLIGVAPFC